MKPSRMPIKKSGAILVDFLVAGTLVSLVTLSVVWIVLHLWVFNFVSAESFFLARSRLYGNTQSCETSKVVSQTWIDRKSICYGSTIHTEYEILPSLRQQSKTLLHLPQKGRVLLSLER